MKNIRKALIIALTLCALTALLTVSAWATASLVIVPSSDTMYAGMTYTLTVNDPEDLISPCFQWDPPAGCSITPLDWNNYEIRSYNYQMTIASDAEYVQVRFYNDPTNNGQTSNENTFYHQVKKPTASAVIIGENSVRKGESIQMSLSPSLNNIQWSTETSDGIGGAYIDATGKLYGAVEGVVKVIAAATNELNNPVYIDPVYVTVTPAQTVTVQSIKIQTPGKVFAGFSTQLTALVNNTPSTDVDWNVIDGDAVINENGLLTPRSNSGGYKISVKATSTQDTSKWDVIVLDVSNPYVTINSSNRTDLKPTETTVLTATDYPNGTQTGWTWNFTDSSFRDYAELTSNGSYQAGLRIKAAGKNIIVQATDANGVSATITINTSSAPSGTKTVFITSDEYYPSCGQTITVRAKFSNSYDSDNTLTHWVYDKNILEMTYNDASSAKFKAVRNGSTKITAYARKDNEMYGVESNSIDITVSGSVLNHQITYGNYSTFDGTNPLYFITNDYITNFKGVTVDGYVLTNGNQYYSTSSSDGHILVAMNPAYLKMLSSSSYHTIQIYSTVNGPATGYFRNYGVSQTIYGVRTGDDNNIALWVTLCTLGFAGAAAIIIMKRREIFGK